jgi:hypothetical protein
VRCRPASGQSRANRQALIRKQAALASYALRYSRQARFVRPALVDGKPGLSTVFLGRLTGALGFTFEDETITEIEMIDIPAHLRRDVIVQQK